MVQIKRRNILNAKLLLPYCVILLVCVNLRCVKIPINNIDPGFGSRNYTWTVDSIYAPYNSFLDLTGSSPADLWTANDGDADKVFYHFNGSKWSTDNILRPMSPFSIFSVTPQSVWSGGFQGRIWHYNGTVWKEHFRYTSDTITVFEDIHGDSDNNIFAVGQMYVNENNFWGIILHYDGSSWKRIEIPKIRTAFTHIRRSRNGKWYLLGVTNEHSKESTYQLYEYNDGVIMELTSGLQNNDQMGGLLELGKDLFFIIGFDFYSYQNNSFEKIGRLSDSRNYLNVGFGRSSNDIFLGMRDGIAHYNGINTEYMIATGSDVFIRYGMVFNEEVFMMGRDSKGNNLIYHGVLK